MAGRKAAGPRRPIAWPEQTIFTIGHSTRTIPEFAALLLEARVDLLVDVRSFPRSRTNPQFNLDVLPDALAQYQIGHLHIGALGGKRGKTKSVGPSPNDLWQNASFRNYADYAMTEAFREGLKALKAAAREHRAAIMCAEAVWWRCHRRIIADFLLADGVPVAHIMGPGKIDPAKLTPGAQPLGNGRILYHKAEPGEFSLEG